MPYADPAKRAAYRKSRRGRNINAPLRYGTLAHLALCYLKVVRRPVPLEEFPKFSSRLHTPRPNVDKLIRFGYATYDADNRVVITPSGVTMVYELGRRNAQAKGRKPVTDAD